MFGESSNQQDSLSSAIRYLHVKIDSSQPVEERLTEKLKYWQNRLGLTEWQLWIKMVEPGEFSYAHVEYDEYHYQGIISINNDHPAEHWDHTIVHELLHIMLGGVQGFTEELLAYVEPKERKVLEAGIEEKFEPVLNRLARAIVGTPRPYLELK